MIESFWLIIISTAILTNFILLAMASLTHVRNEDHTHDEFADGNRIRL